MRDELLYLKVYNRRENLGFYGLPEKTHGKEDSEEVLNEFLTTNLEIEDASEIEYQRVHRIGTFKPGMKPWPIIARFLRYPDRENVFSRVKKLKGTNFSIAADFPKVIAERRKKLVPKLKEAKQSGKRAFFSRAEPDKLYIDNVLQN